MCTALFPLQHGGCVQHKQRRADELRESAGVDAGRLRHPVVLITLLCTRYHPCTCTCTDIDSCNFVQGSITSNYDVAASPLVWPSVNETHSFCSSSGNDTSPCLVSNGGCSHLCLPLDGAQLFTCECPGSLEMSADGSTCTACTSPKFTSRLCPHVNARRAVSNCSACHACFRRPARRRS